MFNFETYPTPLLLPFIFASTPKTVLEIVICNGHTRRSEIKRSHHKFDTSGANALICEVCLLRQKKEEFVEQRGVYDKMIIDCAFKENLQRKKQPSNGGCNDFVPSITTNGLCYTFNGQNSSEIWKPSKMMTTFSHLFPSEVKSRKKFGGTRTVQGNKHNILKKIHIRF